MSTVYAAPTVVALGEFAVQTGNTGRRNWDEFVFPFDEWK